MHDASEQTVRLYARDEIRRRLRDPSLAIANVLPREAWEEARIPRSASLPVDEIRARAHHVLPDREREIAVYCEGPGSELGAQAVDLLQELGYRNVGQYPGGIEEWVDHGEPVESGPDEESELEGDEEETVEGEALGAAGGVRRASMLRPARFRPVAWIERLADLSYAQLFSAWLGMVVVLAAVYWLLGRAGFGGLSDGGVLLAGDWQGFASALYFSLVIMYDAAGLRRAAGKQAAILNRLIEEHFVHPEADTQRLMELLGHTPFEVAVGAILGVASALLWNGILR